MVLPATKLVVLLVLLIANAAGTGMTTVALAALLAVLMSTTETGAVTEALLTCVPTPLASALKLIVTELPGGNVTVEVRRDEDVVVAVTVPPAMPLVLIRVAPFRPEGSKSLTVAPVAVLGPALLTTNVKTVVWLSTKVVGLADLVIDKST